MTICTKVRERIKVCLMADKQYKGYPDDANKHRLDVVTAMGRQTVWDLRPRFLEIFRLESEWPSPADMSRFEIHLMLMDYQFADHEWDDLKATVYDFECLIKKICHVKAHALSLIHI